MVEKVKREGDLNVDERRRLRHLLKKIETINLRQNTLYRILETTARLQVDYLRTGLETDLRPVSLRMLARRLDLAPSTVSRALHGRSVELPNGEERPLALLTPGRRRVLREVIAKWLEEPGMRPTDAALAERLRLEFRIRVSRRTVNAVRHDLDASARKSKARR
jgi:DNA-directed RNA polymerase specialized sigma54-like protein